MIDVSATTVTSVVVAIVTYQRPDDLPRTLELIAQQVLSSPVAASILVIDNDPAGSGQETVRAVADRYGDQLNLEYRIEASPGIASARNRALEEGAGNDLLIFIDDDETPVAHWLDNMVATYVEHRSVAVVGPVVSEFRGEIDPWIAAGGFFERRRMPTGSRITTAATNNLLLDLSAVRAAGLRFDVRFGLTGGSDTLFTRELHRRGGHLVWCDEAIVVDHVPVDRATRQWVLRRAMRYGNTNARTSIELARNPMHRVLERLHAAIIGSIRIVLGLARYAVGKVTRSQSDQARGLRTYMRGIGFVRGALGSVYVEYARPAEVAPAGGAQ